MAHKHRSQLKRKNLIAVLGGMAALLGLFLPYVEEVSFFQSLHAAPWLAPALTLAIALATVLYALGLNWIPQVLSLALLLVCGAFPVYACWAQGVAATLVQLRPGAWVLLLGLLLMALSPLFPGRPGPTPPSVDP